MRNIINVIESALTVPKDLHFRFQFDAARGPHSFTDYFDQRQNVLRGGGAVVHNEISMHLGNLRPADARAFETEFVDQPTGTDCLWVFEDATRAGLPRLAFPARLDSPRANRKTATTKSGH